MQTPLPHIRWKWIAIVSPIMGIGSAIAVGWAVTTTTPENLDTPPSIIQAHIHIGMTPGQVYETMTKLGWHIADRPIQRIFTNNVGEGWQSQSGKYSIGVIFEADRLVGIFGPHSRDDSNHW
jgi:hypothetical protein